MIVWLASYPRSGNTLLRQVFKKCFQMDSFGDLGSVTASTDPEQREVQHLWGHMATDEDRQTFYDRASCSPETFLVKTHEPPIDHRKAIYVVRDGRLAVESFFALQQNFHPGTSSFYSLLCGDHLYGDWSTHYRQWQDRPSGRTLLVRFEDLVRCSGDLLRQLADFIGYRGAIHDWDNPQPRLRQAVPAVFGEGRTRWTRSPLWTDFALGVFFTLHGRLMRELGYADPEEVERHSFPAESDQGQLLAFLRTVVATRWERQRTCDERLDVIEGLKQVCDERLALIHRLVGARRQRNGTYSKRSAA